MYHWYLPTNQEHKQTRKQIGSNKGDIGLWVNVQICLKESYWYEKEPRCSRSQTAKLPIRFICCAKTKPFYLLRWNSFIWISTAWSILLIVFDQLFIFPNRSWKIIFFLSLMSWFFSAHKSVAKVREMDKKNVYESSGRGIWLKFKSKMKCSIRKDGNIKCWAAGENKMLTLFCFYAFL